MAKKESVSELFAKYEAAKKARIDLEKTEDLLKTALKSLINPNEERDGVFRKVTVTQNVSYSKVLSSLVPKLTPKYLAFYEESLKENTTESSRETFSLVKL